jgi:hypothetical protein
MDANRIRSPQIFRKKPILSPEISQFRAQKNKFDLFEKGIIKRIREKLNATPILSPNSFNSKSRMSPLGKIPRSNKCKILKRKLIALMKLKN